MCLLAAGNNNVISIKVTKFYIHVVTLSARDNQKLAKLLSNGFEISINWNECKTKCGIRRITNFVGVNILFVSVYSNREANAKRFNAWKYYLPIKWYDEIKKLRSRQSGDYTSGCLLDYDYMKIHYRLITVVLSGWKLLDVDH